jgi:hypothetical protein
MTLGQILENIFTSVLIIAIIIFLTACSSSEVITVKDFKQIEEKDTPDKIRVTTRDSTEYHFVKPDYYFENDTLYGKKKYVLNDEDRILVRKIDISDIESIQTEIGAWDKKLLLIGLSLALFTGFIIVVL